MHAVQEAKANSCQWSLRRPFVGPASAVSLLLKLRVYRQVMIVVPFHELRHGYALKGILTKSFEITCGLRRRYEYRPSYDIGDWRG